MSGYAIITGGARGIGSAISRQLLELGLKVIVLDKDKPPDELGVKFFPVDLSSTSATAEAVDWSLKQGDVFCLVNNVGVVLPALLEDTDLEDFDKLMSVNVRCAIQCSQLILPKMRERGTGRIVNIASRAALGKELRTNYSASKAALIGLTRTWSLELASAGITVNCVCPGPIATELYLAANPPSDPRTKASLQSIPVGRIGEPEDIANAVRFFVLKESSFITGQTLYVCGGSSVGRTLI